MFQYLRTTPSKVLRCIQSSREDWGLEKRDGIWHVTGPRTEFWDSTSLGVPDFHGLLPREWVRRIYQMSLPLEWKGIHLGPVTRASWKRRLKDRSGLADGCEISFGLAGSTGRRGPFYLQLAFEENPRDCSELISILRGIDDESETGRTFDDCAGLLALVDWMAGHREELAAEKLGSLVCRLRGQPLFRPSGA